MENYTTILKQYDLKVTPQRIAIVEELYKNGHMNIDELYRNLLSKFPSISLATIYKNINSMVEKLFLSEVKIPESKSVYELTKTEHAHMVCSSCGSICDIMLDVSSIVQEASTLTDFRIDSTSIVLNGTCGKCCNK